VVTLGAIIAIGVTSQLSGCRPAALRLQPIGTTKVAEGGNHIEKQAVQGEVKPVSAATASTDPEVPGAELAEPTPFIAASAPQGYPPLSVLGRLGQLRLYDAPTQLIDGDLATGLACTGQTLECSVHFRLSKAARVEVFRIYVERTGVDAFVPNSTQENATNSGNQKSASVAEVSVELHAPLVDRILTARVAQDFLHWNEVVELPQGDVHLKIKSRSPISINDLALFSSSGEWVNVAWKPESMLVRAMGPFYREGPEFSMISTLAFAEELQSDLRVIRRFPASEVIPLEGTEYALVRRDGAVSCPGAFHNYEQSYVVLDRSSGLLAFWQNSITTSLFQKGSRLLSRSYSVATDEETELELKVLSQRVLSKKSPNKPPSGANQDSLEKRGFRQLPSDMPRDCRAVTAKEGAAYAAVTPAAAETDLGKAVLSCPLGGEGRLLVYTDPCWEEVGGIVTWTGGVPRRLTIADGASSIQLRRGPNDQWLVAVWRQDAGQIFRIDANGDTHLLFANAIFGTRQVESCRCSA
jgi:hypothetical protein